MKEREEKGLLRRLADFWKQGGPETDGGLRRIRQSGGVRRKSEKGGEPAGSGRISSAGEERFYPGRPTAENGGENGGERTGGRLAFAVAFGRTEKGLFAGEGTDEPGGKRKSLPGMFGTERGKPGRRAEEPERRILPLRAARRDAENDTPVLAQAFLWAEPGEATGKRKALPPAGVKRPTGKAAEEEAAEGQAAGKTAGQKAEEVVPETSAAHTGTAARADGLPDLERLMREMTKRLWQEREGCGRRRNG